MKTKILLVDDDPTLSSLLGRFLQESNFELLEASNGPAGLRLAYNERPDLVLLDVMMPGMDGWEVCARLRELSDVPVIMLTAKTAEADKLRGFKLGVDDYVTKPYSFVELVARIQAVLGRVQRERKETGYIAHGEIVLNMEKYQATPGRPCPGADAHRVPPARSAGAPEGPGGFGGGFDPGGLGGRAQRSGAGPALHPDAA